MKKFNIELFPNFVKFSLLLLLISGNSFSQSKPEYRIFSENAGNAILSRPEMKKAVSKAIILNIDKSRLQELSENRPLK